MKITQKLVNKVIAPIVDNQLRKTYEFIKFNFNYDKSFDDFCLDYRNFIKTLEVK